MMKHLKLRWFILVLMILNAVFYVWREGVLQAWDLGRAPCVNPNANTNKSILKIF
jgi:hypothetical protein